MRFCQSCGMPLTDDILGTNADGSKSEEFCIYCYKDGAFTGNYTMEEMADYCSMFVDEYNKNMGKQLTKCEYKQQLLQWFPKLKRWSMPQDAIPHADHPMKQVYIDHINALGIDELHVNNLYVFMGAMVNQFYTVNGNTTKLLNDNEAYWGTQIQKSNGRCYGVACNEKYILVSEYNKDGTDAEVVTLTRIDHEVGKK